MRRLYLLPIVMLLAACGSTDKEGEGPTTSTARVASADGVEIAYEIHGDGPGALLFIHDWSCDRDYWVGQVEAFAGEFQVVTIDLAGHGESGLDRSEWTIQAFGRDVEAVVDGLGLDSVILIGHAMGGMVALEAARRMPDKVVGIVGVDALHDFEFRWDRAAWQETIAAFEQDFRGSCSAFARTRFRSGSDPELVAGITEDLCSAPPQVATALLAGLPDFDLPSAATAAGVPIRCINSAVSLPTRIEVNRRYADFDAHVMEGVGHFPMLERPDEFNALLRQVIEELTSVDSI